MSSKHLRNVARAQRTNGGHEHWTRSDLDRPITIQTHVDPIPEFIIKNALTLLCLTKKDFTDWI